MTDKQKIVEYGGKRYALVIDNEEGECSRCALRDKCNDLQGTLCQDEVGLTYEETVHHRFEELKDDSLTEQKIQEHTKTASDRANEIAWCLVILLAAQLIGGKMYNNFFVACAGGLICMLLSALQAAWHGAAIWWFKNHHADEETTDYPAWIGGPTWGLYYLKMAVITASVVYIAYSFLRLL